MKNSWYAKIKTVGFSYQSDLSVVSLVTLLYVVSMTSWLWVFGLFFTPLADEFGWSRSAASVGVTTYLILSALVSPFIGRMGDRYGYLKLIFAGLLIVIIAYGWLSRVSTLWAMYLCYGLLGIGNTAGGIVPGSAIISQYYRNARGLMLGITALGLSLGGFLVVPYTQYFIELNGFRGAFIVLAVTTAGLGLPAVVFLHRALSRSTHWQNRGHNQFKGALATSGENEQNEQDNSVWTLLSNTVLATLVVAVFFNAAGELGMVVHQFEILKEGSGNATLAAFVVGLTAALSSVGKILTGLFGDRYSSLTVLLGAYGLQTVGVILVLGLTLTGHVFWIYPFLLVFGIGVGGCVVGRSIVVAQTFGFVSYGLLMGVIDMAHQLGAAIGIWFPSHFFDISGNYIWGIYFFLGCYFLCLLLLRRTQILSKRQRFLSSN